jgi:sugar lactone lactonase YvrE
MNIATVLLSLVALHDHGHGHGHHHAPATAPTAEHRIVVGSGDHTYEAVPGWCKLPDGKPLGNTHGGIVIDAAGLVYFNTDTERSIMVYEPDGTPKGSLLPKYPGIHGMVIREERGREVIYAAHLKGKQVLKLDLKGSIIWRMEVPAESGKYDDNPGQYNPTSVAVGPDGDIYVADGYGRNWIHQFDKNRIYIRTFGGYGKEPGQFRTCHGIGIDERGETPVLLVCDRENRRLQRFDLEGNFIDVCATELRRPCSLSFHGDLVAVAELEGRVTILDKDFKVVAHLGDNPDKSQWAKNPVPPEAWKDGIFTAPHGCCFDAEGNIYVQDWNAHGRVSKLKRVTRAADPAP